MFPFPCLGKIFFEGLICLFYKSSPSLSIMFGSVFTFPQKKIGVHSLYILTNKDECEKSIVVLDMHNSHNYDQKD